MAVASRMMVCLFGAALAQQKGTLTQEALPAINVELCTHAGGCKAERRGVTLDANWRWVHNKDGYNNCFSGSWDSSLCPDPETCAKNCAIEGIDMDGYLKTYGVQNNSQGVDLQFVSPGGNVGSRLFVTEHNDTTDETRYMMFKLKNREFSFDVDVSKLPCGLNGALYFVEMKADGGKSEVSTADARYGTGYCDAQCPHDVKWLNGQANSKDWNGLGHYGSCCAEMDIWEANGMASAVTLHPCQLDGHLQCDGVKCGDDSKGERYMGVCDKDGCDFNPYRLGQHGFYGPGLHVDTTKPMTVVTQFVTADGTDEGDLVEVRRIYVQDGKVIENANASLAGPSTVRGNSVTDSYCSEAREAFMEPGGFEEKGGVKQMGEALGRGMVLVLSLWDDTATAMHWLDSASPEHMPTSTPGVLRGPCNTAEGRSENVRSAHRDSTVAFANIKVGEIGSTLPAAAAGAHRRLSEQILV